MGLLTLVVFHLVVFLLLISVFMSALTFPVSVGVAHFSLIGALYICMFVFVVVLSYFFHEYWSDVKLGVAWWYTTLRGYVISLSSQFLLCIITILWGSLLLFLVFDTSLSWLLSNGLYLVFVGLRFIFPTLFSHLVVVSDSMLDIPSSNTSLDSPILLSSSTSDSYLKWGLALFGLALLLGGLFLYFGGFGAPEAPDTPFDPIAAIAEHIRQVERAARAARGI